MTVKVQGSVCRRLRRRSLVFLCALLIYGLTAPAEKSFAQNREEVEERKTAERELENLRREVRQEKLEKKAYKMSSMLELSGGYETNPRLSAIRKGDTSGHLKYSFNYKRPMFRGVLLSFNYNFDGSGYSELNELTNLLNHTRLTFDKSFNKYLTLGMGYDFSSFYYPQELASDFYFHKGIMYLRHNITKKIHQQVTWEEGWKDYPHSKAYEYSLTTFQDKDRRDWRHGVEHSLGANLTQKLYVKFRTKYSINDSNAFYQDYNDYHSMDYSPFFNYKLSKKFSFNMSLTVSDKDYKNRLVGTQSIKRHDTSYSGQIGLRCDLTKNSAVNLGYGYTESRSNDPTTEYTSSSMTGGWQYKF